MNIFTPKPYFCSFMIHKWRYFLACFKTYQVWTYRTTEAKIAHNNYQICFLGHFETMPFFKMSFTIKVIMLSLLMLYWVYGLAWKQVHTMHIPTTSNYRFWRFGHFSCILYLSRFILSSVWKPRIVNNNGFALYI